MHDAVVLARGSVPAGHAEQADELRRIQLTVGDVEQVPRRPVEQPGRLPDGAPQPGDVGPQRVQRGGGWLIPPDRLDQAVGGDDGPGLDDQRGQQRARPRSADVDRRTPGSDLQRPQDPELQG